MATKNQKWKGTTGGGYIGQSLLLSILSKIRVVYLYPLLYVVVPFYMLFGRKPLKSIYFYHKTIRNQSVFKAWIDTWKNYILFGKVVLDKFALLAGNVAQFKIDVLDKNHINDLVATNNGGIIAGSHIGNLELSGYFFQQNKKKIYALSYDGEMAYYQNIRSKALKNSNIEFIPVKKDLSHLFLLKEIMDNNQLILIPSDRINGSSKHYNIDFFGHLAQFPVGAFHLATTFQCPLISLFVIKQPKQRYVLHISRIETIGKKPEYIAQIFVKQMEDILKKYPTQWFNFFPFWTETN